MDPITLTALVLAGLKTANGIRKEVVDPTKSTSEKVLGGLGHVADFATNAVAAKGGGADGLFSEGGIKGLNDILGNLKGATEQNQTAKPQVAEEPAGKTKRVAEISSGSDEDVKAKLIADLIKQGKFDLAQQLAGKG